MITLRGLITAIRLTARAFKSSRSTFSSTPISIVLYFLGYTDNFAECDY